MIRRFDNDEGASEMYECDDGTFVVYEDHLAVVQRLEERVRELEGELIDISQRIFFGEFEDL